MRLPFLRFHVPSILLLTVGSTAVAAALLANPLRTAAQAPEGIPQRQMTLMGTLSEWKYPGSKMLGGASMSDGGNPSVVDVKCQAILTTPDPIEKVAKFYSEKLATPAGAGTPSTKHEAKEADARAVSTQDDSDGRPVAVKVIVVSTEPHEHRAGHQQSQGRK